MATDTDPKKCKQDDTQSFSQTQQDLVKLIESKTKMLSIEDNDLHKTPIKALQKKDQDEQSKKEAIAAARCGMMSTRSRKRKFKDTDLGDSEPAASNMS
jgi:hypothetical protein